MTKYPICFFEVAIFDNNKYFKLFGEYILNNIDKKYKVELEMVSNSKLQEILEIKNI